MIRNGGYLKQTEKWWYRDEQVKVATYYSYLGLIFSSRLCWSKCIENHVSKSLRVLNSIRRMLNAIDSLSFSVAVKIFDIKVKPILLYGSEIWGTQYFDTLENVQIKFFKMFLGVGRTTENCFILREIGRYPLWVDTRYRAVKYWCKLLQLPMSRYPRKCYVQQYRLAELGRLNWAQEIKNILFRTGFGSVWMAQELNDPKAFLSEFKNRIISISHQDIDSLIREKYPIYLQYNPSYDTADYLHCITSKRLRRFITLLRTRSLPIRNNLERINIAESNVCTRCNMSAIDDEIHLIFTCPALTQQRLVHLPCLSHTNPNYSLVNVMNAEYPMIYNHLCSFLKSVLYPESLLS